MVSEMFQIYGGQIHAVEAFMKTAPSGMGFGREYQRFAGCLRRTRPNPSSPKPTSAIVDGSGATS